MEHESFLRAVHKQHWDLLENSENVKLSSFCQIVQLDSFFDEKKNVKGHAFQFFLRGSIGFERCEPGSTRRLLPSEHFLPEIEVGIIHRRLDAFACQRKGSVLFLI